jgi:cytochrome c peroxidase
MSSKSWSVVAAAAGAVLSVASCGIEKPLDDSGSVAVAQSALLAAGNLHGVAETVHSTGSIDRSNPFFQALGTNPRTCETCHAASQGWTLTAAGAETAFLLSGGTAPLFLPHDAGARPDEDLSTVVSRLLAFGKTLLARGLIRFGRTVPATAQFTVTAVTDPAGFATPTQITNFRRPTPVSNESKTSSVTWTGGPIDVPTGISNTAIGAASFHEQRATALPADQAAAIRDFELGLAFAQTTDWDAGPLDGDGATGGPTNLLAQPFYLGINDILGGDPAGPFTRNVFTLFDAWKVYADQHDHHPGDGCDQPLETFLFDVHGRRLASRAAIYRGQELFNNLAFSVSGVHGLNDVLGADPVQVTCSTCHNAPNVGGHSVFRMFDVGTADAASCGADLPLLTLQKKDTGDVRTVCDMGKGGNGVWSDVGSFRAPPLRGLAARAPYFHDGQASTLTAVVTYFDRRFNIGLTNHQKRDLEAFLGAL